MQGSSAGEPSRPSVASFALATIDQMAGSERLRQLQELLDVPREDLGIELKAWLDLEDKSRRADVARELLALANHGGGYLIFGFEDRPDGWTPAGPSPYSLDQYTQDFINGLCERYADPPFHCEVFHETSSSGDPAVIVVVPGGHRVPIRSRRGGPDGSRLSANSYYVRRPGPQSAPVGSSAEWDELLRRCVNAQREELLEGFRTIALALGGDSADTAATLLAGISRPSEGRASELAAWEASGRERLADLVRAHLADERPSRYGNGGYSCAYSVEIPDGPLSLIEFRSILEGVAGHETGWPPWWFPTREGIRPYVAEGVVECWLAEPGSDEMGGFALRDGAHSDLWRGHPAGRMFLFRGYQEDGGHARAEPGTQLDVTLPVWRTGECLLHVERLARRVGASRALFMMRWDGLEGRELVAHGDRDIRPGRVCMQDAVVSVMELDASKVTETLPELVRSIVEPLYELFDFFRPPDALYAEELNRMRSRA